MCILLLYIDVQRIINYGNSTLMETVLSKCKVSHLSELLRMTLFGLVTGSQSRMLVWCVHIVAGPVIGSLE